jgi:outer membrane lipoprotein-sorting protein
MRIFVLKPSIKFITGAMLALLLMASACQQQATTNSTNGTNTMSANAPTTINTNSIAVDPGTVINTREPEKYRATLIFSAETEGGEKTIGIPTLSADVARNGQDRRLSFKLPDGSQLIYLDAADKHYIIVPNRKQYAELTAEATGVELQKLMTPGQLVAYLSKQKGYERVGEEQLNGRTAEKYRYAAAAKTGAAAGNVRAETFVYVDKETGLPLRSELFTEASGSVEGIKGGRVVAEMRDIQTEVNPADFELPAGMNKVSTDQIRQQLDALAGTVTTLLKALLSNMNMQGGTTAPQTTAPPPTPAATASPATH